MVARAEREALAGHDPEQVDGPIPLAIRWNCGVAPMSSGPSARAWWRRWAAGRRRVGLVCDRDTARLVGRLLVEELGAGRDLVAVDELNLATLDDIDVGEPLPISGTSRW